MATFRGNHPAKVDEKGRLKLPAAFKQLMDAEHVSQFYITSTDGTSAEIWPLPQWEQQEKDFTDTRSTMDVSVQKYITITSYYGQQVEIDSQGRVTLPQKLREKGKLDAEVVVLGKLVYLEVQNEKEYEGRLPSMEMTADDRKSVAAIVRLHS